MKSHRETQAYILKSIRPPYESDEVEFLRDYVLIGLKTLKDIWRDVNYEEMCETIISIPDSVSAPEWESYWKYWKKRFEAKKEREERNDIFNECIIDITHKWLMPVSQSIKWLTGNFTTRILTILEEIEKDI
jgi:hypothetical protein